MISTSLKQLKDVQWGEFFIGGEKGLFEVASTLSGIDKNKLNLDNGDSNIPYITRTEFNNGVNLFVPKDQKKSYEINKGNVITIGLDTQTVFYQQHEFYTGQNIQVLSHEKLTKNNALFIIPLLKIQMQKFNWGGNGATLGRLARTKIVLPVTKLGEPDWDFMDRYVVEVEQIKKQNYSTYVQKQVKVLKHKPIKKLEEKTWSEFCIDDIFYINSGKRLTKKSMIPGIRPFIGATDSNNGVTNFISNTNSSLDQNVLGVNYNGSVCESFYHPYECIFSDDVKRLTLKNYKGNKYIYLFFKNIIMAQKPKYTYGYKFNENRMRRQLIMVPVTDNGDPDYLYMEQYIKNMMLKKYKQYQHNKN